MIAPGKFIELCLAGEWSPDMVDYWVEEWHASPEFTAHLSLAGFLGMTADEYAYWARTADIEGVLHNRRQQAAFDAVANRRIRRDVP